MDSAETHKMFFCCCCFAPPTKVVTCQLQEALALSAGGINAGDSLGATVEIGASYTFLLMPASSQGWLLGDLCTLPSGCLTSLISRSQKQEKE